MWAERAQPFPVERIFGAAPRVPVDPGTGSYVPGDYGSIIVDDEGLRWRRREGSAILTLVED